MTHPINRLEEILDIPVMHYRGEMGLPGCGKSGVIGWRHTTNEIRALTCRDCIRQQLDLVEADLEKCKRIGIDPGTCYIRRALLLDRLK